MQTVMRAHGIPDAYDRLKAFTRGRPMDEAAMREFIGSLTLPRRGKERLAALEPKTTWASRRSWRGAACAAWGTFETRRASET